MIFNAEKSISGTGGDALQLLEKIPGIRVDNNSISLIGKGSVGIMIGDRLIYLSGDDLFSYLKSISSDQISTIEIISHPSAKYDAQGNNGLINIILKKPATDGLQGSANQSYSIASYPTFAGGADLSYRNKKLSASSNLAVRNGSVYPSERSVLSYPGQTWDIMNRYRNFRKILSGQLQVDYRISKKVLIGGLYNGSYTDFHSYEKITSNIYHTSGSADSILISDANAKIYSSFHSANLFFKKYIDTNGKQLMINADWFASKSDSWRQFDNHTYIDVDQLREGSYAQYLSASNQHVSAYTIKADMDMPIRSNRIAFGGKLSFIRNLSDISFYRQQNDLYIIDQDQFNIFKYLENTQAAYVSLNRSYKKWTAQIGLRGEYTQTNGVSSGTNQAEINSYFRLFPTAFLSYRINELRNISFSYGKRINRPPYKSLNPFRWYSNQYAYLEGNPFLKPSFNDNFELSHSYKNLIITTLSYSRTNNGYNTINFTDTLSNLQVAKPINFIRSYNYQLSNSVSVTKINWMQSNNEFDLIYHRSASFLQGIVPSLARLSAYISTSNEIYFVKDKTFAAELTFWYQFSSVEGLQISNGRYNLNAGTKLLLLKKHVQLTLGITDVLKSNQYRYTLLVNHIKQSYENYYDSRQLRLSVRYVFGNDKARQQTRQTGNAEETKRNK